MFGNHVWNWPPTERRGMLIWWVVSNVHVFSEGSCFSGRISVKQIQVSFTLKSPEDIYMVIGGSQRNANIMCRVSILSEIKLPVLTQRRVFRVYQLLCFLVAKLCLTLQQPHGLQPTRLLCPWDFLGKITGVGCHFLLQGSFSTQGSNPYLLHWQADSLPVSHLGAIKIFKKYQFFCPTVLLQFPFFYLQEDWLLTQVILPWVPSYDCHLAHQSSAHTS